MYCNWVFVEQQIQLTDSRHMTVANGRHMVDFCHHLFTERHLDSNVRSDELYDVIGKVIHYYYYYYCSEKYL